MRLPRESQLSREQREICFAPAEGTTLVVGPPGSGKTVVALFRAQSLEKREEEAHLLVYNRVLRQYTGSGCTFEKWLGGWWKGSTSERFPYVYESAQEGRRPWKALDYESATELAKTDYRDAMVSGGHWGHLVLDEAQDFPPEAHSLLFIVQNVVFGGLDEDERPSLMILADENQRLNDKNSTIEDIKRSHMLTADDAYDLRSNYRNTKEIAKFARHFYVGLQSGTPELPSSKGEKPEVVTTENLDAAVDRIVTYAKTNENQEIGVLVCFDKTRKRFFNKIKHRLQGTEIPVQTYGSSDKNNNDATKLVFDDGGAVTVLCYASSKGLEFDAVFLPELQSNPVSADHSDVARMNLYVMCSRARSRLFVMASDRDFTRGALALLPKDEDLFTRG